MGPGDDGLRILVSLRSDGVTKPGGDVSLLRSFAAEVSVHHRVEIVIGVPTAAELSACDLVMTANLDRPIEPAATLTLAEAAGVPMVVVPYPHAAAHQRANAAEMVDVGAALLVPDEDLDGDTLRDACDLLFDARLETMSAAAYSVGRPGSAAASAVPNNPAESRYRAAAISRSWSSSSSVSEAKASSASLPEPANVGNDDAMFLIRPTAVPRYDFIGSRAASFAVAASLSRYVCNISVTWPSPGWPASFHALR